MNRRTSDGLSSLVISNREGGQLEERTIVDADSKSPASAEEATVTPDIEKDTNNTKHSPKGQVYWIRHGESEGNEKNIFSGVVDLRLTAYGELQGKRAAVDLQKKFGSKGGVFDAVYTSNLYRAIRTKELALSEDDDKPSSMVKDDTDRITATEICERSQGIFTGENKALVMALLGTQTFNQFLKDASYCPLGGESGGEIYDRCQAFYTAEIQPRIDRGENVLIVCHEFVMMGMVTFLSGKSRNDFLEFKVPNGQALSSPELIALLDKETDPFNDMLKAVGDWTVVNALKSSVILYILGAIIRIVSGSVQGIPSILFKIIIVGLNCSSSTYTYLEVDLKSTSKNVGLSTVACVVTNFVIRWAVALLTINLVQSGTEEMKDLRDSWMLWIMIPPAMTNPGVARLTGGNVYESATLAPSLSIILPLLLFAALAMDILPEHLAQKDALEFFWAILAAGLWFPCALTQFLRWKNPVKTAKHTNRWKFLTGWSVMGLGFFAGFQTCPPDFFTFIRDVNGSGDTYDLSSLSWALGIWLGLRFTAIAATGFMRRTTSLVERQLVDIMVMLTQPNYFLWLALLGEFNSLVAFWAGFFFFGGIAFEQRAKVVALGQKLCKASVGGSMMLPSQIDELVNRFDANGDGVFDVDEIKLLLKHFYRDSGEPVPSPAILDLLATKMMKLIGTNHKGEVPRDGIREYLKGNGLLVNANATSSTFKGNQPPPSRKSNLRNRLSSFQKRISSPNSNPRRSRMFRTSLISRFSAFSGGNRDSVAAGANSHGKNVRESMQWGDFVNGNEDNIIEAYKEDTAFDNYDQLLEDIEAGSSDIVDETEDPTSGASERL